MCCLSACSVSKDCFGFKQARARCALPYLRALLGFLFSEMLSLGVFCVVRHHPEFPRSFFLCALWYQCRLGIREANRASIITAQHIGECCILHFLQIQTESLLTEYFIYGFDLLISFLNTIWLSYGRSMWRTVNDTVLTKQTKTEWVVAVDICVKKRENNARVYVPTALCLRDRLQVTPNRLVVNS